MKCTIIIVLALFFWLLPAAAQDEGVFEGRPTDFLPLEVGNQWTYYQTYGNYSYGWRRELAPEARTLFELPGYPYDNPGDPPDSLLWVDREFTIEITHTEVIDGWEYFVFSRADYDWPPIPTLFWAGQKVRLSDEGVLLFRWNEQDVPLYDLNPQHPSSYSIPAYPIREDLVTKLYVRRWDRDESQIEIIFSAIPEINLSTNMPNDSVTFITVLPRYGLVSYSELYYGSPFGEGLFFEPVSLFHNTLYPISAIISGEAVSYDQVPRRRTTHVQSSSWGQLKRAFRPQ